MFINELIHISVLLLIITLKYQINSLILQPFYWNQTTFRSYQDNSLIFEVRLGDVMDIVCPYYHERQSYMSNDLEQYDIYYATKNEYDMCSLDPYNMNSITRLVISCDSPYDVMKYTLNFRSYLPIPNGFEFHSNQTYYFLSTSSTHQQCNKLKIIVHDSNRVPSMNEPERKPLAPSSYLQHRHGSSSIDKSLNTNDNDRFISYVNKAQRHSNPHSIEWITESPHESKDLDKSSRSTSLTDTPISPSNMLRLALNSSSSKLSITFATFFLLLAFKLI